MLKTSCPWGRWDRRPARAGTAPHFAFGYGLGYTTWECRAGREVVQAYAVPHSRDRGRPLRTLAAFATVTAKPGRAAEARPAIAARACARYGEAAGGWGRPPGEFTVRIGRSSADRRLSVPVRSG